MLAADGARTGLPAEMFIFLVLGVCCLSILPSVLGMTGLFVIYVGVLVDACEETGSDG